MSVQHLEEDPVVGHVPPEVGDGIAAVAAAGLDLEDPVALQVRAHLACHILKRTRHLFGIGEATLSLIFLSNILFRPNIGDLISEVQLRYFKVKW